MSRAVFKTHSPVLLARDVEKAMRFYVDRLGFQFVFATAFSAQFIPRAIQDALLGPEKGLPRRESRVGDVSVFCRRPRRSLLRIRVVGRPRPPLVELAIDCPLGLSLCGSHTTQRAI